MLSKKTLCPNCANEILVSIREHVITEKLTWSASYRCSQCDYAEEADGSGQLPDDLREIVLAKEGTWHLILESMGEETSRGLKALKDVLGLPTKELSEMRQNLPIVLHSGTKTEVHFYKERLENSYTRIVAKVESD